MPRAEIRAPQPTESGAVGRLTVTICGTFSGGLSTFAALVEEFTAAGVRVMSPADPTPAGYIDNFLVLVADSGRDSALIERRHLEAVAQSDFVWVIAPSGYVGTSTVGEICYAAGRGVPVFTDRALSEPCAEALVHRVRSPRAALEHLGAPKSPRPSSLLLDVAGVEEHTRRDVDFTIELLSSPTPGARHHLAAAARRLRTALAGL